MSHLGRSDGKPNPKYTLAPVAAEVEKLLKKKVIFVKDSVGPEVEAITANPPEGSIILLENLRYHIEEEGKGVDEKGKTDQAAVGNFCKSLSKHGDVYVNDAFGTAYRVHSSMVGVALEHNTRPPAFYARDTKIDNDLVEKANAKNVKIHLPVGFVIADKLAKNATPFFVSAKDGVPVGMMGLDCGLQSTKIFSDVVKNANMIVWNVMMNAVEATAAGAVTVIGGGDTATAAAKYGIEDKVSHVSSDGGASLGLVEGKVLPGVRALNAV